jgi:NhaP-type Na+/H+ or K+/H+ antiporter
LPNPFAERRQQLVARAPACSTWPPTRSNWAWTASAAIAFFGIRGVGSVYYLADAVNHAHFPDQETAWSLIAFVVLTSIVVHGVSATAALRSLDAAGPESMFADRERPDRASRVAPAAQFRSA